MRVRRIEWQCDRIHEYELVAENGAALPPMQAGAHIEVKVPGIGPRHYSLCNDETERHRYVIGVLRQDAGRGGSRVLHDSVRVGDVIEISPPRNHFRLDMSARAYVLIGGGIGLTPILAMARSLVRHGKPFRLFACSRSRAATPFVDVLARLDPGGAVQFVHDGGQPGAGLDAEALLASQAPGEQVYCCGPASLMDAVARATRHWQPDTVHFERFSPALPAGAATPAQAFSVQVNSTGQRIPVPPGQSVLDCLRSAGVPVESSCEQGICGTCEVGVLGGTPQHLDDVLDSAQKAANNKMMVCVSRAAAGECLVLDL